MENAGLKPLIMVDCSHGNSQKNFKNQPNVLKNVCDQISGGNRSIIGVMIESNLVEGNQKIPDDLTKLVYGKSVTDSCVSFAQTEIMLRDMATSVRLRNSQNQ